MSVIVQVLAEQHFSNLNALLAALPEEQRPKLALLTGSTKPKAKREIHADLADGRLQIVVGTHSLVTASVAYHKLGLAVIDEQQK